MANSAENPKGKLLALRSLESNPGWAVYRERYKQVIELNIDAKIFDTKTSNEERAILVQARKLLMESYVPEKMIFTQITSLEGEVKRLAKPEDK